MNRFFYADRITNFLAASENEILGALATENSFDLVDLQRDAWKYEIKLLKKILACETEGQILFELSYANLKK